MEYLYKEELQNDISDKDISDNDISDKDISDKDISDKDMYNNIKDIGFIDSWDYLSKLNIINNLSDKETNQFLIDAFSAYKILCSITENTKNQIHIDLLKATTDPGSSTSSLLLNEYKMIRQNKLIQTKMSLNNINKKK